MRNRAKCKLCNDIIESFHPTDYIECSCENIFLDGGEALRCGAKDFTSFVRIDDKGEEVAVKFITNDPGSTIPEPIGTSKEELLGMLKEMIASYEALPPHAGSQSPTNYDLMYALSLVYQILCR